MCNGLPEPRKDYDGRVNGAAGRERLSHRLGEAVLAGGREHRRAGVGAGGGGGGVGAVEHGGQRVGVVVVGAGDRITSCACAASGIAPPVWPATPARIGQSFSAMSSADRGRRQGSRRAARMRRQCAGRAASAAPPRQIGDLGRLAGALRQLDDRGRDGEVLEADAGAVEEGDLVRASGGRGGRR